MQWENLTAPDFAKAVLDVQGVCLLPLAVVEKHGEHLPLGTDLFEGMEIARRAAELEPAIVFPPFYFTQILEAKHQPGTIALEGRLMLDLLEAVCDEIARNGLNRIVLVVAHGGSRHLAPFFVRLMLERKKDYMVYLPPFLGGEEVRRVWSELQASESDGHAGELETSLILATHPDLVKMDQIGVGLGSRQGRLDHLPGIETPISWYANFPNHYGGDASSATSGKGEQMLQAMARALAGEVAKIKQDTVAPQLYQEFFNRTEH